MFHFSTAQSSTEELTLWHSHQGSPDLEHPRKTPAEDDVAEFGELVSRYENRLFHSVLRLVGNAEDARDVVQETFLRAYQHRDCFKAKSAFFTWLYRIAINTAIGMKRKQRRERGLQANCDGKSRLDPPDVSDTCRPGHDLEMAEEEREVHEALGKLSFTHRAVLVMKDMEELKYEEIAGILGVPVGTIRSRLHRARLRLRQILIGKAKARDKKSPLDSI